MSEKTNHSNPPQDKDQYFIPLPDDNSQEIPESVSSDDAQTVSMNPSLALKPLRFLRRTVTGLLSLLLVLIAWQSIELLLLLSEIHWLLGAVFVVILLVLSGLAGRAFLEVFRYRKDFRDIEGLRESAEAMRQIRSTGQGKAWLQRLQKLYRGKPQQEPLGQALTSLPDYADDAETIQHIDSHLLQELDQQALATITRHSRQAALMVALSPIAMVDMLLAAWRALRMIDEICQIYGLRPSLPARTRLLKMVLEQIAMAGAAELISGQLAEFASNKVMGMVSAQAASGLGVGLYSARIGVQVMDLCRPVPFSKEQKPGLKSVAAELRTTLLKQFSRSQ